MSATGVGVCYEPSYVFGRPRLLQVFGCVFTVFQSSGVPPTAAAAESLPGMQQGVLPERYLDNWGDHLFHNTFTRLTQRLRLGGSAGISQLLRAEEMATAAGTLRSTGTADSWDRCGHHYRSYIAHITTLTVGPVSAHVS